MNKAVQMVNTVQNVEKDSHQQQLCACTVNITLENSRITVVSVEGDSRGSRTMMNICANMKAEAMRVNTAPDCSKLPKVYGTICRNTQESLDSHAKYVGNSTISKTSFSNT